MNVQLNTNLKDADRFAKSIRSKVPQALKHALNRTGQKVKTEASRGIRERYHIKAKDISPTLNLERASKDDMNVKVDSKGKNIPLIKFKTRPASMPKRRPKVLRATVKKDGGGNIPGAFIARMKSGHTGVFLRAGRRRLPIKELYGPGPPIMLNNERIREKLEQDAREEMDKRFDHEVNRLLGKVAEK